VYIHIYLGFNITETHTARASCCG